MPRRKRNRWRFQPYVLRHTAATALRAKGADLADVQALMGHKHASTTQRYAPAVSDKLFEAVARTEHR